MSIKLEPTDPNYELCLNELDEFAKIEHEFEPMKLKYDEVIGFLNGEEILMFDWMLEE